MQMKKRKGLFWITITLIALSSASMAGFVPPQEQEEGAGMPAVATQEQEEAGTPAVATQEMEEAGTPAVATQEQEEAGMPTVAPQEMEGVSAPFSIARLVIAGSVENLEPVGVVDAFAASTEKVYCFLEAKQIKEDTTVRFVWYHGETKTAVVDLPLKKGARWRTYSSKKLGGRTGDWRVEVQDAEGHVLEAVGFAVE
jgi:hypothetical protein